MTLWKPGVVWVARTEDGLHVEGRWDGEVPRKMGPRFASRRVYIPSENRAWRLRVAKDVRAAVKALGVEPGDLQRCVLTVWSEKGGMAVADLDTIYHQAQDAMTKDAFSLRDDWSDDIQALRMLPPEGAGCMWFIEAWYRYRNEE